MWAASETHYGRGEFGLVHLTSQLFHYLIPFLNRLRANCWTSQGTSQWTNQWTNQRTNQWTNQRTNQRTNQWTNQRTSQGTSQGAHRANRGATHGTTYRAFSARGRWISPGFQGESRTWDYSCVCTCSCTCSWSKPCFHTRMVPPPQGCASGQNKGSHLRPGYWRCVW